MIGRRPLAPLLLLAACAVTPRALPPAPPVTPFEHGFEGPLEGAWRLDKLPPGRWALRDGVASEGSRCVAVTLLPGEERAELQELEKVPLGADLAYEVDLRLPADFPDVDGRLVLLQVKQEGDRSPVLALRYRRGELRITSDTDAGRRELFRGPFARDAWHRVALRARFRPDEGGRVDAWLDGRQVVALRGVTAYASQGPRTYLKLGLYRDAAPYALTVLVDRFRRAAAGW